MNEYEYMIFAIKDFLKTFPRNIRFFFQRIIRGWDDSETWDLQYAFLKWFYPRIKRYKKVSIAFPADFTAKSWDQFQENLISRLEKAIKDYDLLGEMSFDEEEAHFNEVTEIIKIIFDHLRDFGW